MHPQPVKPDPNENQQVYYTVNQQIIYPQNIASQQRNQPQSTLIQRAWLAMIWPLSTFVGLVLFIAGMTLLILLDSGAFVVLIIMGCIIMAVGATCCFLLAKLAKEEPNCKKAFCPCQNPIILMIKNASRGGSNQQPLPVHVQTVVGVINQQPLSQIPLPPDLPAVDDVQLIPPLAQPLPVNNQPVGNIQFVPI